jgi:PEP-CTERM motif
LGSFSQSFSLLQTVGDLYGTLFMSSVSLASIDSQARGGLTLDSITLVGGAAPLGGLGVRLDQTGQIIPVTAPVPEPGTWAMWLAGVATMGLLRRRMA